MNIRSVTAAAAMAAALATLPFAAAPARSAAAPTSAAPPTAFAAAPTSALRTPRLKVSDDKRFLVTADGKPFFYLGDTAWELFHRLTREDAER